MRPSCWHRLLTRTPWLLLCNKREFEEEGGKAACGDGGGPLTWLSFAVAGNWPHFCLVA